MLYLIDGVKVTRFAWVRQQILGESAVFEKIDLTALKNEKLRGKVRR